MRQLISPKVTIFFCFFIQSDSEANSTNRALFNSTVEDPEEIKEFFGK